MSDDLCINTIRCLSADVVQKANSGHPGAPMGMAPMAHVLWTKYMKMSPANPLWWNRDRFVLSNGHACALQYILLHLTGYEEYTMDQLQHFRKLDHKTPGHPENCLVKGGIEVTTGPLGQGIGNAVGLAISQKHLAAVYNKPGMEIFNNHTYVFCGDGCLQEGVSAEASSLAGHLGLGNLIMLYDDNHISIDGDTELSFTEDVLKRYESYGWHTQFVEKGDDDLDAISKAIEVAQKVTDKPSIIKVRTTIGKGSTKQGTEKVHGSPLGADEVAHVKELFGFDKTKFFVIPDDVQKKYSEVKTKGKELEGKWNQLWADYQSKYPEEAKEITRRMDGKLPDNVRSVLPTYKASDEPKATRQYSEACINALAKVLPELVGGSADLTPSNLTHIKISKDFQKDTPEGRNVRFGVREHGMAAVCNGMIAYGGVISYAATFLNFIGYAAGAVRLSALSHFGVIYVMTHDSISLGEDGPTHQPIESLVMLRATPNILVIRPADGNETSGAYVAALENRNRPTVIALGRAPVPNLEGTSIDGVLKGAYVLGDQSEKADLILTGSGGEIPLCVEAAATLKKEHNLKARVVSMPSWELFQEQSIDYQKSVLPEGTPVLAVEAGAYLGWREYAHACIAMHGFGSSGPAKDVLAKFGFTPANIVEKSLKVVEFYKGRQPHDLITRAF